MIKTDNADKAGKVALRKQAVEAVGKKTVTVLDAFAGQGTLWDEVRRIMPGYEITVHGIERRREIDRPNMIKGDNRKVIPSLDLSVYDVIDLDAYGSPYPQLRLVLEAGWRGVLVATWLLSDMGAGTQDIYLTAGFTKRMYKNARSLLRRHHERCVIGWLHAQGFRSWHTIRRTGSTQGFYFWADLRIQPSGKREKRLTRSTLVS